ncbi:MAG: DUF2796 domain-containing protein [Alphaproteobacteria bacterium]|nr:DUF2796 domain-containing protein [Alphaproteobacteria bacterium]
MRSPPAVPALACLALGLTLPLAAKADDTRPQQSVHTHGAARIELAQDGAALEARLVLPARDALGFEHAPASEEEKAKVESVLAALGATDAALRPNAEAGCAPTAASATLGEPEAGHDDHDDHEEHAGDAGKDDHHDDAHADGHDDHHEEAGQVHSDVIASYGWTCAAPAELSSVHVTVFALAPSLTEVEVQFATEKGQGSATARPGEPHVELR